VFFFIVFVNIVIFILYEKDNKKNIKRG